MLAFTKNFQTLVKPLWQLLNANLSTQSLNAHISGLPMCDSQFGSLFCYYCCFSYVITMRMTMHMIVVAPTILIHPLSTKLFNGWFLSSNLPSSLDFVPHSLGLTHRPFSLVVLLEFPFKSIALGSIFNCWFPSSFHLVIQMCGHMFL